MNQFRAGWLAVFSMALVSCASGQMASAPADACLPEAIGRGGEAISFPAPLDEKTYRSIGAATLLALSGPQEDWPVGEFKRRPLCEPARMTIGADEFVLKRNSGDGPIFWASSMTNPDVVFLALGPTLSSAYDWHIKNESSNMTSDGPTYMLTLMRNDPQLHVTRIYDERPPLDVLQADIAATIRGELPTIVIYDRGRGLTSVRLPAAVSNAGRFWR